MPPEVPSAAPLRVADGLDVVVISDNEILVQFGSRSHPSRLFRDTDLTGVLGRVFGRLQAGPASRDDLLAEADGPVGEAAKLLDRLSEHGILISTDTDPVEQYLGYTFTGHSRLSEFQVAQIGAGPVGAQVAETLLGHGVGRLRLLDDREQDATWSRFVSTRDEQPDGTPARAGLRDRLLGLGYAGVEAADFGGDFDALATVVAESDLVLLTLERPDVRFAHLLNRLAFEADTPWITACIDGHAGVAGPLFVPNVTACYNDYRVLADASIPSPAMARVYRRHAAARGADSFFPGLPAYAAILGGFVSLAAVHMMLSGTSYLLGRTLTVDFDSMFIDVEDVLRLPRCPVCRKQRSSYQPPFSAEAVTRGRLPTT